MEELLLLLIPELLRLLFANQVVQFVHLKTLNSVLNADRVM